MKKTRTALSTLCVIIGAAGLAFTPIAHRWIQLEIPVVLGDEYAKATDDFAYTSTFVWIAFFIATFVFGVGMIAGESERNDS